MLVSKTGLTGSVAGTLAAAVPGVTFSAAGFAATFAPSRLSITGTGVSLTVAGQAVNGNFTVTTAPAGAALHVDDLNLSIGGVVGVTNGTGDFTLARAGAAAAGITGSGSARCRSTPAGRPRSTAASALPSRRPRPGDRH